MVNSTTPQAHEEAPGCKHCGGVTVALGKLPPVGLKRLIKVFRCTDCNQVSWTEH